MYLFAILAIAYPFSAIMRSSVYSLVLTSSPSSLYCRLSMLSAQSRSSSRGSPLPSQTELHSTYPETPTQPTKCSTRPPLQTECWGAAGIFARTILSRRSTEPCRNGGVLCRGVRIKHPTSPTERDVDVHAKLAALRDQCVVTEQEFQEQKAKVLGTKTANQSQKRFDPQTGRPL